MTPSEEYRLKLLDNLKEAYDLKGSIEQRLLYTTDPSEQGRLNLDLTKLTLQINQLQTQLEALEQPAPSAPTAQPAQLETQRVNLEQIRTELQAAPAPSNATEVSSTRRLRVFLAHAHADRAAALELYHKLKAIEVEPWLDKVDLIPGQRWQVEIPKAVRASDIVLVCVSSVLTQPGYIHKEINLALDKADEQPESSISIIPIRLTDCEVPDRLADYHWVDLFEEGGFANLFRAFEYTAKSLSLTLPRLSTSNPAPPASPVPSPEIATLQTRFEQAITREEWDTAITLGESLLLLDGSNQLVRSSLALAYNNRGFAYDDLKQYERAISDYDKAIQLDPNFAIAYNNRGFAYNLKGDKAAARRDFQKAADLGDPDASEALKGL